MELRHLRYFITVAEELNFRRAAERLYMEQPPLSRQIRQLEEELGVELFYRNKREVSLTKAGQAFLDEARLTLAQAERAAQIARQANGKQQQLSIGFSICAFNQLLPEVIQLFRQRFPSVSISLTEMSTPAQVQALVAKEIDVAFVHLPVTHDDIVVETVLSESLVVVLPQGHPLSELSEIPIQQLAQEPFVVCPQQVKPDLYAQVMEICQQAGFQPKIVQEATPPEVVVSFVAAGAGISLVAAGAQSRHNAGVVYRAIAESTLRLEMGVAWHKRHTAEILEQFLDIVRQTC